MIVFPSLQNKIRAMAAEVGAETLAAQDDHYYEREVLDEFLQGGELTIIQAVDLVTYLRTLLTARQEAS